MLEMSQSFTCGTGGIEHNLRITRGNGLRQNGIIERRHFNEYMFIDETLNKQNYVEELIRKTIQNEIGDKLAMLNEKHIAKRHPERVRTLDEFIKEQQYEHKGKTRKIVQEYIIQVGDKFSGCPYVYATDNNGNMLDDKGIIKQWDTRKTPAYAGGEIIESNISKQLKQVYKQFIDEFIQRNPNARLISAAIHGDERAGCHCHINVIWVNEIKNGVGVGFSKTTAIQQQYAAQGIKTKTKLKQNAQRKWTKEMRTLLQEVCEKNGIKKLDMHNTQRHRSNKEYGIFADRRCEAMERRENDLNEREHILKEKENALQEKEAMLSTDIARQEWFILKKFHPDVYEQIHKEYIAKKHLFVPKKQMLTNQKIYGKIK